MFPSVVPSLTTIVDRVDHCEMRLPASATRLRGGVRGIQIDKEYREFSQIIQSEQLLVLCIIQYFIVLCIYCVLRIVPPCLTGGEPPPKQQMKAEVNKATFREILGLLLKFHEIS